MQIQFLIQSRFWAPSIRQGFFDGKQQILSLANLKNNKEFVGRNKEWLT
jgi:hypothetical protein